MNTTSEPTALADLLECFEQALDEEILAIQDDLGRRGIGQPVQATGGHEVDVDLVGFAYDWTLPPGRYVIRPDDAVRVAARDADALGFVTRWDPASRGIRINMTEWLGRLAGPAELTFDPTWLLSALDARLGHVAGEPSAYHTNTALGLFGLEFPQTGRRPAVAPHGEGLNRGQAEALERVLGSRTQLVWGPPGTGKTRLLGAAAAALAVEGRVLVLATTNVAVDEAARRVADHMGPEAAADGRVVRVGAGFSPSGDADLSVESVVQRLEEKDPGKLTRALREMEAELGIVHPRARSPGLRQRIGTVLARAREAGAAGALVRAGHLTAEFQRAGARVLARADVVLTTFARLTLRDDLWKLRFRSLLVDEASTVPLPYLFAGACLSSERAVAVGDFRQLPSVVMSTAPGAARWLSRDIFRQSGSIDPDGGRHLPDPRDGLCSMLSEQYRMAPKIRRLVSDIFYGGRLVDAPEVASRPAVLRPLLLVDTVGLDPIVERAERSRANPAHVEVLIQLLEILARRGVHDVGVVTPYRLQSRRIWSQVRSRLGRAAPSDLEIATIHRFQGREKTAVILDTVDAPPGGSWFLNERRNPDFPRLLNVAVSRCRESLIVVGTTTGLATTLPADALLNRTLRLLAEQGRVLDADRLAVESSVFLAD
jgi:hypothetical protein